MKSNPSKALDISLLGSLSVSREETIQKIIG